MKPINRKKRRQVRVFKTGRPMDETAIRTPSGQKSRSKAALAAMQRESEAEIKSTVIEARQRHALQSGEVLDDKEAADPHHGYPAGRLFLAGRLGKLGKEETKLLLQTGNDVAATWRQCRMVCGHPPMTPQAADMGRVRGLAIEGANAQERARRASNQIMTFERILGMAGNGCRSAFYTAFLLEDRSCESWPPHMYSILRKALQALKNGA